MRDSTPGHDPRPAHRRPVNALVALVVSLAIAAGACSGDDASPGVATAPSAESQPAGSNLGTGAVKPDAVAYAQCMRDNGVPAFPDPDSNGQPLVDPEALEALGVTTDSETYKACAPLLPNQAKELDQATHDALLEAAKCMRDQGITNFPDPSVGDGAEPEPDIDSESPQFLAAHEACRHLLPNGGAGVVLEPNP